MKQREILKQKLKEKGFKPLPVKSINKQFKEEVKNQKEIVAKSLSEVIDSEGYIISRDIEWTLYFSESGFEAFGKEKYDLKEVGFSRTRRYIDRKVMQNEFRINSIGYNKAIKEHFEISDDVDLHTGKSKYEKIFYKTTDGLHDGLGRDFKVTRMDVK